MTQPLSSWEDTSTRQTILEFVANVTDSDSEGFVPPADRIATFDNDGTLWCERPFVQGAFISDRLMEVAKSDLSLRQTQPWKAIWDGDSSCITDAVAKHYNGDDADLKALMAATLKGFGDITVEDFAAQATSFYETAVHPVYKRPYQTLGYVPMIEVLDYLEASGF